MCKQVRGTDSDLNSATLKRVQEDQKRDEEGRTKE
jgi:hypothetical protein